MNIEIRDQAVEARIRKMIEATGAGSVEEVLIRLLETQEEQDRWLEDSRTLNDAKIQRGIDQLRRGEGIPEEQLAGYLSKLKTSR
jgi:hypothetical protein